MTKGKLDARTGGGDEPTLRPERIPIVLVAGGPDDLVAAALARDVNADLVLIKVKGGGAAFLEQALRPSLRAAFRRFRTEIESGPVKR
jgi:hypothetical protein